MDTDQKVSFILRLSKRDKERAQERAQRVDRSLNSYIRELIRRDDEAHARTQRDAATS